MHFFRRACRLEGTIPSSLESHVSHAGGGMLDFIPVLDFAEVQRLVLNALVADASQRALSIPAGIIVALEKASAARVGIVQELSRLGAGDDHRRRLHRICSDPMRGEGSRVGLPGPSSDRVQIACRPQQALRIFYDAGTPYSALLTSNL